MITCKVFPQEQSTDGRKRLYLPEIPEKNNYLLFITNKKAQYEEIKRKMLRFIPIQITGFPLEKLVCLVEQSQQGATIGNMQSEKQN